MQTCRSTQVSQIGESLAPFVEDVGHHKQGGRGKNYANQGSGDHVIRVVIVVTDSLREKNVTKD